MGVLSYIGVEGNDRANRRAGKAVQARQKSVEKSPYVREQLTERLSSLRSGHSGPPTQSERTGSTAFTSTASGAFVRTVWQDNLRSRTQRSLSGATPTACMPSRVGRICQDSVAGQLEVPNTEVLERGHTYSMHALASQRRLPWLGHVRRMDDGRPKGPPVP